MVERGSRMGQRRDKDRTNRESGSVSSLTSAAVNANPDGVYSATYSSSDAVFKGISNIF